MKSSLWVRHCTLSLSLRFFWPLFFLASTVPILFFHFAFQMRDAEMNFFKWPRCLETSVSVVVDQRPPVVWSIQYHVWIYQSTVITVWYHQQSWYFWLKFVRIAVKYVVTISLPTTKGLVNREPWFHWPKPNTYYDFGKWPERVCRSYWYRDCCL